MFRIHEILDTNRRGAKRPLPSEQEINEEAPGQRAMPYFSIVPTQVLQNVEYLMLAPYQQGLFWRLVVHVLWPGNGLHIRHSAAIAKKLGIPESEWIELEMVLLDLKMIIVSPDGINLICLELRSQYLQTLAKSDNRKCRKEA